MASTANETRPKVTIKSLHPLAYWRYNCKGTECQICNHDLTNLCLSCFNRSKEGVAGPLEINPKCQVVIGSCQHAFHIHCAETWYMSQQNCAVCQKPWIPRENEVFS